LLSLRPFILTRSHPARRKPVERPPGQGARGCYVLAGLTPRLRRSGLSIRPLRSPLLSSLRGARTARIIAHFCAQQWRNIAVGTVKGALTADGTALTASRRHHGLRSGGPELLSKDRSRWPACACSRHASRSARTSSSCRRNNSATSRTSAICASSAGSCRSTTVAPRTAASLPAGSSPLRTGREPSFKCRHSHPDCRATDSDKAEQHDNHVQHLRRPQGADQGRGSAVTINIARLRELLGKRDDHD